MPLKLFDRKRICLSSHLKSNEQVTAFSGFGSTLVVGTCTGCLLIFDAAKNGELEEAAKLKLSEERDSKTPIVQICCASALGLILAIIGDELFGLVLDTELMIEKITNKTRRIALNSHSSNADNPFSIQLAIAHSQKQQILVGQLSTEEGGSIANDFRKEHKLTTQGRVAELAYSGQSVCYATEAAAYFVHNLTSGKKSAGPIHLFDATDPGMPRVIGVVGMEEFALAGIQGLLMFANGQGASTRPPISLPGQYPAAGLSLKEPFLYILDTSGMVFIFSTMDDQLKQCLDFPSDDDQVHLQQHQQSHFPSANSLYKLVNIDGQLFVVPPNGDCIYELVSMAVLAQIEEHIQLGQLDVAMGMLDENVAQICTSANEQEILQLRQLQQKAAFLFMEKAEFEKAFDLLTRAETDPRLVLSMVATQHRELKLIVEVTNLVDGMEVPFDGSVPDIQLLPLPLVKLYLERIYTQEWAAQSDELIECTLARIYTVLGEFERTVWLRVATWNNREFRQWLASDQKRPNCAAKLAMEAKCAAEAFNYWREMVVGKNSPSNIGREQLTDCFHSLAILVDSAQAIAAALPWLVPIDPVACMAAVERLEQRGEVIPPELVVRIFEKNEPELLFSYLDTRVHSMDSPDLHDKMFDLYLHCIKTDSAAESRPNLKQKLRHFLLFSPHYDRQRAQQVFGTEKGGGLLFSVERLLAKAENEETAIGCLQELTENAETDVDGRQDKLSAAELLCTRFPSAELLNRMLTLHLRLSKEDPALRTQIPRILCLLDSDANASEVLQNVPADLCSAALVRNFLRRHVAARLNARHWQQFHQKLVSREHHRLEQRLAERMDKTSFRLDERSACCIICERALMAGGEQFVRNPLSGQLAHLRCHQARKERDLLELELKRN